MMGALDAGKLVLAVKQEAGLIMDPELKYPNKKTQ